MADRAWSTDMFSEKIGSLNASPTGRDDTVAEILRHFLLLDEPAVTPEIAEFLVQERTVLVLLKMIIRGPVTVIPVLPRSPYSSASVERSKTPGSPTRHRRESPRRTPSSPLGSPPTSPSVSPVVSPRMFGQSYSFSSLPTNLVSPRHASSTTGDASPPQSPPSSTSASAPITIPSSTPIGPRSPRVITTPTTPKSTPTTRTPDARVRAATDSSQTSRSTDSTSRQSIDSTSRQSIDSTSRQSIDSTSRQSIDSTSRQSIDSTSRQSIDSTSRQSTDSTSRSTDSTSRSSRSGAPEVPSLFQLTVSGGLDSTPMTRARSASAAPAYSPTPRFSLAATASSRHSATADQLSVPPQSPRSPRPLPGTFLSSSSSSSSSLSTSSSSPSPSSPSLLRGSKASNTKSPSFGSGLRVKLNSTTDLLSSRRPDTYRLRATIDVDSDDTEELMLSHAATLLFMKPPLSLLLKKDPIGIIRKSWGIFSKESKGNFWHWKALVERALACDWGRVCRFLLSRNCIVALIDHLGEPSIQDILLHNLLNGKDINAMKTEDRLAFFSTLSLADFLPQLCERIYSPRSPDTLVSHASVFFRRLLEDLAPCKDADRFFIKLGENFELLGGLMDAALNETRGPLQQKECALCLECLFDVSQRRLYTASDFFDSSDRPTLQDNTLQKIRGVFFRAIRPFIRPLAVRLARLNSERPDRPLDSHALSLITILHNLISFDARSHLNQLPGSVWGVLIGWFFHYAHHNIYHKLFTQMICHVVRSNHLASLESMLLNCRLVERMAAVYTGDRATGCRGHILLIANTLRLVAMSLSPQAFLPSHLAASAAWHDFCPLVERDTVALLRPLVPAPEGSLRTLQWTCQAIQDLSFARNVPDTADPIGLGSRYAIEIGLGSLVPYSPLAPIGGLRTSSDALGLPPLKETRSFSPPHRRTGLTGSLHLVPHSPPSR